MLTLACSGGFDQTSRGGGRFKMSTLIFKYLLIMNKNLTLVINFDILDILEVFLSYITKNYNNK